MKVIAFRLKILSFLKELFMSYVTKIGTLNYPSESSFIDRNPKSVI